MGMDLGLGSGREAESELWSERRKEWMATPSAGKCMVARGAELPGSEQGAETV